MDKPEALRLADLIQSRYGNDINDEAAAELRRLLDRRVMTSAIETQTPTRGTQPPQSVQGATHEPTQ